MNIEAVALQLARVAKLARRDPLQAMTEISEVATLLELSHLRDAVVFDAGVRFGKRCVRAPRAKAAIVRKEKVLITRLVEARVRAQFAQGSSQGEIAKTMQISVTAVNHLIHGKYAFAASEAKKPKRILSDKKERLFDEAYQALHAIEEARTAMKLSNKPSITPYHTVRLALPRTGW